MMNYKKRCRPFVCLLAFCSFFGCFSSGNNAANEVVKNWQHKTIIIPEGLQARIFGKDTIVNWEEIRKKQFHVLSFTDTANCTECNMRLYEWRSLMQEVEDFQERINFIFVVHAHDFDEIDAFVQINRFNYPMHYDYNNAFFLANKGLPTQPEFSTFLLDQDFRVILTGNPVRNEKLWNLYKQQMDIRHEKQNK